MKISLFNFLCYRGLHSFRFPSRGVVLLAGESGSGKSSILKAIEFALYGVGKNLFTFNTTKCHVEIVIDGLKIFRQRGPNVLKLVREGESTVYIDDVAQSIIDEHFGNETVYGYTNVCHQDIICPFLLGNNADKIKLLEHVAFKSQNFIYKKKLQDLLHNTENLRKKLIAQVEMSQASFNEIQSKIKSKNINPETNYASAAIYKAQVDELVKKIHQLDIAIKEASTHMALLNKTTSSLEILQKEFTNITNIINTHVGKDSNIDQFISESNTSINSHNSSIAQIQSYKQNLAANKEIERQIALLSAQQQDCYNSFISINGGVSDDLSPFEIITKAGQQAEEQVHQVNLSALTTARTNLVKCQQFFFQPDICLSGKKILKNLMLPAVFKFDINQTFTLARYIALADEVKNIQDVSGAIFGNCPGCNMELVVVNNEILDSSTVHTEISQDQNTIFRKFCQHIDTIRENVKFADKILADIEAEIAKYQQNIKITELAKQYKQLYNTAKIYHDKPKIASLQISENPDVAISRLTAERNKLQQAVMAVTTNSVKLESILRQISESEQYIKENKNIGQTLKQDQSAFAEFQRELEECQKNINDSEWVLLYRQKKKEHEVLQSELVKTQAYYNNLCMFRNMILDCESELFEQTLNSLSSSVNSELENLFTSSILINLRTEVKANVRTGIDLGILFKGEIYKSHTQLSGGESKRLGVAFSLAFNKYVNGRFLILDETLSCVGTQLRLDTIELLKEVGKTKLVIIVNHDIVEGQFDFVVNAGTEVTR